MVEGDIHAEVEIMKKTPKRCDGQIEPYAPTEEEIRHLTRRIRGGWTQHERMKRLGVTSDTQVGTLAYRLSHNRHGSVVCTPTTVGP